MESIGMKIAKKVVIGLSGGALVLAIVGMRVCMATKTMATKARVTRNYDLTSAIEKENIVPIAIIGSGPAGLSAAVYGARAGVKTMVIYGSKPGGLLTETTWVENWPGAKIILGTSIIDNLKDQASHLGAEFLDDTIAQIDFSDWPFVLKTEGGKQINALAVIIATGSTPRMLGIPGEQQYWGAGVSSCAVCDAPFFKNQNVVVIGGGDSAVEEAIQLAQFAANVTVLVRGSAMRSAAHMQKRLTGYPSIKILYNVMIEEIIGDGKQVTGVMLKDRSKGTTELFATDGVFLAIGHEPNTDLFKNVLDLDDDGTIKVYGRGQQTSLAGVFAAGDVEDKRYRQAGVAAGSGIKAGLDAVEFLDSIGFTKHVATKMKMFSAEETVLPDSCLSHVVSMDQFVREVEKRQGLVFVDFFTKDCTSCLEMLPMVESVAQEYTKKVRSAVIDPSKAVQFVTIDKDEATDVANRFYVYKVPCLLVFNNGQLIARYQNELDRQKLIDFVERFRQEISFADEEK